MIGGDFFTGETIETEQVADWRVVAWRFGRGAIAAGLAQATAMQFNFSDPIETFRVFMISFIAGALMALSKSLRSVSENKVIQNLPV